MSRVMVSCLLVALFCVIGNDGKAVYASKSNDSDIHQVPVIYVTTMPPKVRLQYLQMDSQLKDITGKILKRLTPILIKLVYRADISPTCLTGLLGLASGIRKTKLWALEMLDASAKVPVGVLAGSLASLGNYEECLSINVQEPKVKMVGQYCTVMVTPPLPEWRPFMSAQTKVEELVNVSESGSVIDHLASLVHNLHLIPIRMGICVPSLCTIDDMQKLVQIIPQKTGLDWNFSVPNCETYKPTILTDIQIAVLVAFGVISVLLAVGTFLDLCWKTDNLDSKCARGTVLQILHCFSVPGTLKKMVDYKPPMEATRFVYGIIFICFIWIGLSHVYWFVNFVVTANFLGALRLLRVAFFEMLLNRLFPIQALLFVSGFVSAYNLIKSEEDVPVWKYILKRFCRYTPVYLMAIAIVMITPILGSGPSWHQYVPPMYNKCRDSWWTNILYINNLMEPSTSCLSHTWYFAVEAQLHVLGLLFLIPLKRKPIVGLWMNFAIIAASLVTVALTNVYYELPPTEITSFIGTRDRSYLATLTYNRVYSHFCLYCTGAVSAYLAATKPDMKISKVTCLSLWLVFGTGVLATMFSVHHWHMGVILHPVGAALYAAFSKAVYALFLGWLAYVCSTGRGGLLNDVLSWRPFAVMSRLAFLYYLFNPVVIELISATKKSQQFIEEFEVLYLGVSYILPTFVLALACYIAVEGPSIALIRLVRRMARSTNLEKNGKVNGVTLNGVMSEKPMRFSQVKSGNKTSQSNSDNHTKF